MKTPVKITPQQIQALYAFTKQHFVTHYDLQTELVDHLANAIETIWETHPELSFEVARDKTFKTFGVYGFMEVVESRHKAMSKIYFKYLWQHLKQWFCLPQLLTTVVIFIGYFMLFSVWYHEFTFAATYMVLAVCILFRHYKVAKQFKKRSKKTGKTWLLESIIFKEAMGYTAIFTSWCTLLLHLNLNQYNTYIVCSMALGFTVFTLFAYISLVVLPNKANTLLKTTYPEYSL